MRRRTIIDGHTRMYEYIRIGVIADPKIKNTNKPIKHAKQNILKIAQQNIFPTILQFRNRISHFRNNETFTITTKTPTYTRNSNA